MTQPRVPTLSIRHKLIFLQKNKLSFFDEIAIFQKFRIFEVFVKSGNNRKIGAESKLGWFGLFSSLKSLNQTRLVFSLEIGKREATLRIRPPVRR